MKFDRVMDSFYLNYFVAFVVIVLSFPLFACHLILCNHYQKYYFKQRYYKSSLADDSLPVFFIFLLLGISIYLYIYFLIPFYYSYPCLLLVWFVLLQVHFFVRMKIFQLNERKKNNHKSKHD
jgi:hypothetical protein